MVVHVTPLTSVADQPVDIKVTGLSPHTLASLRLGSTDGKGVAWSSSVTFRADKDGTVDPGRSAAVAGSYIGNSAMGLLWSMQPQAPSPDAAYFWPSAPLTFALHVVVGGRTVASAQLTRAFSKGQMSIRAERLRAVGFYGEFFSPVTASRRPAVLVFGGSDGGLSGTFVAGLLAARGYPALALAYFKEPGLPQTLLDIPLEYFAKALTWLRSQPEVDPSHVWTLGDSRGSEAALLLGVYYPRLIDGVIAAVPSDAAICSSPDCTGPAWTLHGHPLPYTSQFDNPSPTDIPAAVIPVERIHGPVFLICGGADQVWLSCPYSQAIMSRLAAHHDRYPHVLDAYQYAGHGVGLLAPYEPAAGATLNSPVSGDSPEANPNALAQAWPHLLQFLATNTSRG